MTFVASECLALEEEYHEEGQSLQGICRQGCNLLHARGDMR